jgi:hypothetical protein
MVSKLHIVNSQIVFSFRRNFEIRKRIFEFEDTLKEVFRIPFRSVAIPDEIDPNIPRFESQSIHGHSRLQVSQTRITLATNYNNDYKLNYKQVEEYVDGKSNLLTPLVESEKIDFIAFIVELGIYMDEIEINSFIKQYTGALAINEGCRDFSILYSKEYMNNFFLNVKCSKFREQELILHKETKTLRPSGKIKHGISVVLDLNTRPYFEKNKKFDQSLYKRINEEAFNIISSKSVQDFLKGEI